MAKSAGSVPCRAPPPGSARLKSPGRTRDDGSSGAVSAGEGGAEAAWASRRARRQCTGGCRTLRIAPRGRRGSPQNPGQTVPGSEPPTGPTARVPRHLRGSRRRSSSCCSRSAAELPSISSTRPPITALAPGPARRDAWPWPRSPVRRREPKVDAPGFGASPGHQDRPRIPRTAARMRAATARPFSSPPSSQAATASGRRPTGSGSASISLQLLDRDLEPGDRVEGRPDELLRRVQTPTGWVEATHQLVEDGPQRGLVDQTGRPRT